MRQLRALLQKNWLFTTRRWKLSLLQIAAPFIFVALLSLIDLIPKTIKDNPYNPLPKILHQDTTEIGPVAKCLEWNGLPCKTIRYVINNQPNRTGVQLFISDYFLPESGLSVSDVEEMASTEALKDYVERSPNTTTNGIEFGQWGGQYNYTIHFNTSFDLLSLLSPNRKPDNRNELQIVLDKAIFRYHRDHLQQPHAASEQPLNTDNIKYSSRRFPQLGYKSGKKAADDIGFVFFYCGIMFQSLILLYNLTAEKDLLLRQGLKIIGMADWAYWASWFITAVAISLTAVLVLIATATGFSIKLFSSTDFAVTFCLFSLFALSTISLTIFAGAFIQKTKSSLTVGMLLFILGVLFTAIVSKKEIKQILRDPLLVDQWIPHTLSVVFPFYNLGEAMSEIDQVVNRANETCFAWSNIYDDLIYKKKMNSTEYATVYLPNVNHSFLLLLVNFLLYGLLGLYFDQILPGPNGEPRRWYFPIQGLLKCFPRKQQSIRLTAGGEPQLYPNGNTGDDGEAEELSVRHCLSRLNLATSVDQPEASLLIAGLRKRFSSGYLRRKTHVAVDGVWLEARQGEILAVLGHNGAGKTTTIKMLTGLLRPGQGDAYLNGLSIGSQMDAIRKQLGVCPQHDILWDDLTANEHFALFGALKGMNEEEIQTASHSLLTDVSLSKYADRPVRTFSGGMKRRLSVALSFLGSPRIVFLDEPSSGMDPYVRRDLWNLILRMRHNRVILMTTHSMEEADILASKIAVMVDGKVRAVGSPIELKNRYAGYNIKLSLRVADDNGDQSMLNSLIALHLPNALSVHRSQLSGAEGSLMEYVTVSMPPGADEAISTFLDAIESPAATAADGLKLGSCSVTQTTLEQVFLTVTSSSSPSSSS